VVGARYPNTARIWNYQLGGKDNFAIDREASQAANAMVAASRTSPEAFRHCRWTAPARGLPLWRLTRRPAGRARA